MFEKNMNISFLLDFYGDVLSDKQREILDLYYNEDLSLSEIADSNSLTRQGVRHIIKKAEDELMFLETKLGLANRFVTLNNAHGAIAKSLCEIKALVSNDAPKENIEELINKEIEKVNSLDLI